MTGGIGFSRNSSNSFKENHNLGKVREKASSSNFPRRKPQNPEKQRYPLIHLNKSGRNEGTSITNVDDKSDKKGGAIGNKSKWMKNSPNEKN